MPKNSGPKFDLEAVRDIRNGPEAQARKRHNKAKPAVTGQHFDVDAVADKVNAPTKQSKQRPGEIFSATTPPEERDRLDREIAKSDARERKRANDAYKGKPRAGEIFEAREKKTPEEVEDERVKKFLYNARLRFKLCAEAESENRKDALDDLKFLTGEHWTPDIKQQRELDGRPCLTINRLPQFVRQITNEQRQNRPAVQINPVGDGADTDTAEVFQGIIRHIEVGSDAEIAYDTGFEFMVGAGFRGAWRIIAERIQEGKDEQELRIKRIRNAFNVYSDPAATEPNDADARFIFVIEDMPHSEYLLTYPDSEVGRGLVDFASVGDIAPDWATRDTIRVAEYWFIEEDEKTLYYLEDGTEVDVRPPDKPVKHTRKETTRKVKMCKINGVEILEEYDWPGKYIPIVFVFGDDYDVDGKRKLSGAVRHSKDAMRMYDYWVSAATEMIALAPKAPYIMAEGQDENHEREWEMANQRNLSALKYKPVSVDGKPMPAPERQQYEPPVQAINLMIHQADNDIKGTFGIYDASLGQKGPDESGKAISLRQTQTNISTLNFSDNLARALRHTGRILIECIPHFYDTPRIQRIIDPDGSHRHVGVYNSQTLPQGVDANSLGLFQSIRKIYDIGVGTYDVTVSVGPSYQTKRQEAAAAQIEFLKAFPQAAPYIGDLLVKNFDWNGAKEIAERLKKMLPPQLQDDPDDPEVQAQKYKNMLQQAMQQHDMAIQGLKQAQQIIETKQIEQQAKLQMNREDNQTKVAVAEITTKAQDARMRREFEFKEFELLHTTAHDTALQAQEHQNTLEQGEAEAGQAQDLVAQQAQNQPAQPQAGA